MGPLGKIFNTLGFVDSGYINGFGAPLGSFNVYSFLRDPYMDFGMSGVIIIMFIIGFFVSMLYSKSNESGGLWTIFYANYIYAIIIAFYAYQFSNTFYVYLAILMYITTLFTKKRKVNL